MSERAPRPHGDLLVCGTCGEIKGPVPLLTNDVVLQLCLCSPDDEHRAQSGHGQDFPRWLELCYCCGLDTVSSGSR
jgi:hypothetical protein